MLAHAGCCSQAFCSVLAALPCGGQLPGSVRLAQVLGGSILLHARQAAQAARQMQAAEPADEAVDQHQQQQQAVAAAAAAACSHQQAAAPTPQLPLDVQQSPAPVMQHQQQQLPVVPAVVQAHQPPSPTGVKKTFYKRKLPCPPATEFSSTEGRP